MGKGERGGKERRPNCCCRVKAACESSGVRKVGNGSCASARFEGASRRAAGRQSVARRDVKRGTGRTLRAAANTAAERGGISCLEGDPHQIKETSQRSPLRSPLGRSLLTGNQQGGSRLCDDASSADLEEIDECAVSVCLPVRLSACPPVRLPVPPRDHTV